MVPREAHGTIYTHAGPEMGVGSTKTFTAQLTALYLFAVYLGQTRRQLSVDAAKKLLTELAALPRQLESVLQKDDELRTSPGTFIVHRIFSSSGAACIFPWRLRAP